MSKTVVLNEEARKKLIRGVNILADAVEVTFGPKGNNGMIERKFRTPLITNDGISIAKEITLNDSIENMGAKVVCEAASKTNFIAGDGTTGATILAREIIKNGYEEIKNGSNAIILREGMKIALKDINEEIKRYSIDISNSEDVKRIATISSQDNNIGELISKAIDEVGKDGIITIEESKSIKTELIIAEGMELDSAFASPYFIENQQKIETEMEDCRVLVTDKVIGFNEQIIDILDECVKSKTSLVIIAEEIEGEALQTLVVNKTKCYIDAIAIKSTSYGEIKRDVLEDIAVLTGTNLIDEESGIEISNLKLSDLGFAKKFIVRKDKSTIIGGFGDIDLINKKILDLKTRIEQEDDLEEKAALKERLAKLSGGVAVIRLGAQTEHELKEKYLRLEDALNATKSALEKGVVPGGGSTLFNIGSTLINKNTKLSGDAYKGYKLVAESLKAPLKCIIKNAGIKVDKVVKDIEKANSFYVNSILDNNTEEIRGICGYDALNDTYDDMYAIGIIDPTLVIESAINNAVSIAGSLLTTQVVVAEEE